MLGGVDINGYEVEKKCATVGCGGKEWSRINLTLGG